MQLQKLIEQVILCSRYILVVFYIGLAVALGIYAAFFLLKLVKLGTTFMEGNESYVLVQMLNLIDAALVAGLVVMVMLSSYDNFVARLGGQSEAAELGWLAKLDPGNLKIKVASAIVAISSVHLLQIFLNVANHTEFEVKWKVISHIVFIVSAVALGVLDRISDYGKTPKA
jgi:uncharacterized protein (TIGR00645 family)